MTKFILFNNEPIDKEYFDATLSEFKTEKWELKDITELPLDHVNCQLTFKTISKDVDSYFYESNKSNIVSVQAYEHYLKK